MVKIVQKYDISKMKPIMENDTYAIYDLGFINDNLKKAIRVNKKTQEQVDVELELKPVMRVVAIIKNGIRQNIYNR